MNTPASGIGFSTNQGPQYFNPNTGSNHWTSNGTPVQSGSVLGVNETANNANNNPDKSAGDLSSGGFTWSSQADYDADTARARELGYSSAEQMRQEVTSRENKVRDSINQGFDSIFARLDGMANLLPQYEQEDNTFVTDKYNQMREGIGSAKQNAYDKLKLATEGIQRQSREKTSQVADDLRNMMKATTMQVGAMGGGSSSATDVMLPYAFGKQAARAGAQIARGTLDNLADIDQKKMDVQSTYDTQLSSLDQWLTDSRTAIKDKYRAQLQDINSKKNNADERKLNSLMTLETFLLNQAAQELSQVEAEQRQWQQGIKEWALNRYAQLQDAQLSLQNSGNFNPAALTYDALQGITGSANRNGASSMVNLGVRYGKEDENYY